jgi:hypothetical protein
MHMRRAALDNPDLSFEVGLAFLGNWCAQAWACRLAAQLHRPLPTPS